jgi:hypothetical protein
MTRLLNESIFGDFDSLLGGADAARLPEGMQKFCDIFTSPPSGRMFRPGESRYGWNWLRDRFDNNNDGLLALGEFPDTGQLFQRLDRNRNASIDEEDFDWSDQSPLVRQASQAVGAMQKLDTNSNGQVSAEEWQALFAQAAGSKGYASHEDLQQLLYPLPTQAPRAKQSDLPLRWQRLTAFLRGDTGNFLADGPSPGQFAPDFDLTTQDGSQRVKLSQFRGDRPVVLVFGSFT